MSQKQRPALRGPTVTGPNPFEASSFAEADEEALVDHTVGWCSCDADTRLVVPHETDADLLATDVG